MIVVRIFRILPHIECFINDEDAEAVAGIQEGRRRRVVGTTDCIESTGCHQFHAALLGPVVRSCTQRALVIIIPSPFQLTPFPIYSPSFRRLTLNAADSASGLL